MLRDALDANATQLLLSRGGSTSFEQQIRPRTSLSSLWPNGFSQSTPDAELNVLQARNCESLSSSPLLTPTHNLFLVLFADSQQW